MFENSLSSERSTSLNMVGTSLEHRPDRMSRLGIASMRCRSAADVMPHKTLAAFVNLATQTTLT